MSDTSTLAEELFISARIVVSKEVDEHSLVELIGSYEIKFRRFNFCLETDEQWQQCL